MNHDFTIDQIFKGVNLKKNLQVHIDTATERLSVKCTLNAFLKRYFWDEFLGSWKAFANNTQKSLSWISE